MMEEFYDDDLDNLVERQLDEDINENPEQEVENQEENDKKRIVPVKIRVKKPQPKLNPERWILFIFKQLSVGTMLLMNEVLFHIYTFSVIRQNLVYYSVTIF